MRRADIALDAETTESLLATLRDIHAQLGVTIVIVTHELPVVNALCRRVAVVEDGHIVERFAVADAARDARTRLGRELARLQASTAPAERLESRKTADV